MVVDFLDHIICHYKVGKGAVEEIGFAVDLLSGPNELATGILSHGCITTST